MHLHLSWSVSGFEACEGVVAAVEGVKGLREEGAGEEDGDWGGRVDETGAKVEVEGG